jgi:hypothetical protein
MQVGYMIVIYLLPYFLFNITGERIVSGQVYDADSKSPLPLVNVLIEGTYMGSATDSDGYYKLLIPDTLCDFNIVYSMMGYKEEKRRVNLEGKDRISVNVGMRMKPLKIQGIVVSARREEFKQSSHISPASLSGEELATLPSFIEGDLMRVIEALPGVTKASDFTSAISVRGGAPDQNLILIDNIPILNPSHLFGIVSAFNIDAIRNAKLWVSGIPVEYDASLSSVLDIQTRGVGREIRGMTGVASLSLMSSKFTTGSPVSFLNGNFLVSARRTYADKLLSLFNYDLPYYFYDAYLHMESDFKGWSLILSGYIGKDLLDIKDEDDPSITIVNFEWGNTVGALNLFRPIGENGLFHIATGWSSYNSSMRIIDTLSVTKIRMEVGTFAADYSHKFVGHNISLGVKENYRPFVYNVSFQMGFNYEFNDPWSNMASIFIEDRFQAKENLIFSGGVSLAHYYTESKDFNLSRSAFFRSYRLSGKYFFDDLRALTLSFGNFHQYVVPASLMGGEEYLMMPIYNWIPLTGEYNPEEAHHLNIGCEGWLSESFYFSLEGYYRDYNCLLQTKDFQDIDINTSEGLYRTMLEVGRGHAYGFDFILRKEVGTLRGWLAYTLLRTRVCFDSLTYPTFWDRSHDLHLVLLAILPGGWGSAAQLSFATGNPYTGSVARFRYRNEIFPRSDDEVEWWELDSEKNGVRFPPYFRVDVSVSKAFYFGNNELDLKLSIYNLFNYKNVLMYYYDYDKEPPVKKSYHMLPIIPSIELIYRF